MLLKWVICPFDLELLGESAMGKMLVVMVLVFAVLNFSIPHASAEINQDLDPMVPVDIEMTTVQEDSMSSEASDKTSNTVSAVDAKRDKTKAEEPKKKKGKKDASKKSSVKKSKKSDPKKLKKNAKKAH